MVAVGLVVVMLFVTVGFVLVLSAVSVAKRLQARILELRLMKKEEKVAGDTAPLADNIVHDACC